MTATVLLIPALFVSLFILCGAVAAGYFWGVADAREMARDEEFDDDEAVASPPGIRDRLLAGAEGGREVERGSVLG